MIGEQGIREKLNVVDGVDRAIQRTRFMLFDPVLYSKWLNMGVIIFLSVLFTGRSAANYSYSLSMFRGIDYKDAYFEAESYVLENIGTVALLLVPIFAMIAIVVAALMYVHARGKMMFIRAVAYNDDSIGENWQAVSTPTWSFFIFKLELEIAVGVYLAVAGIVGTLLARQKMMEDVSATGLAAGLVTIGIVSLVVWIAYSLVMFALHNFVAPLMFHFNATCGEAWGMFFAIARENPGQMLLYLIIKIVYRFVFGTVSSLALVCTCCLAGLPVIGHALLSPFYVFERAYSLYIIGSLGPEYAIVQEPRAPEPPILPPAIHAPPPQDINR